MRVLLIVLTLLILVVPQTSLAAGGLVACDGPDCNFCHLVESTDRIITFAVALAVLLVTIVLAVAGFRMVYSQGNPGTLAKAKDHMVNAFIGILLVLASWTIIDTLMKVLVGGNFGVWNELQSCGSQYAPGTAEFKVNIKDGLASLADELANYTDEAGADATQVVPYDASGVVVGSGGANCPAASESSVVTIPGTSYKASPDTVTRFVQMRDAAAAAGINLVVNSGWRSEATQVAIWNNHNCNTVNCSGKVARPCSLGGNGSNHNSGKALDLNTPYNSAAYNWMKTNGGRYGFYNNLGSPDPVHWSPSGR